MVSDEGFWKFLSLIKSPAIFVGINAHSFNLFFIKNTMSDATYGAIAINNHSETLSSGPKGLQYNLLL